MYRVLQKWFPASVNTALSSATEEPVATKTKKQKKKSPEFPQVVIKVQLSELTFVFPHGDFVLIS